MLQYLFDARFPLFGPYRAECFPLKSSFQLVKFFVGHLLNADEVGPSGLYGYENFVELRLYRYPVTILTVLNQEYREESENSRGCIDDKLPSVRIMEDGTRNGPDQACGRGPDKPACCPIK